jgi:DNA-binding response OmpR family regulator
MIAPMMDLPHTVLIVDDELQTRNLLEVLLQPQGYRTVVASTGKEALASAKADPPDLILLDAMMPDMDGRQVAKILKSNAATSNIPIIMLTAQTNRDVLLGGLRAGAEEFLTKPVNRAELWLRVRNLLRLKEMSDLIEHQNGLLEQEVLN